MTSRLDKVRVGKANDGRRKITDDQKLEMHKMFRENATIKHIADTIGCSRRAVQFELFPERLKTAQQHAINAKRWEAYNTADIRREVMRKHRSKKKLLLQQGKVTIPTPNSDKNWSVI